MGGREQNPSTEKEEKWSPLSTQPPAGLQDFSPVIAAAITTNYGDNYRHYAVQ